MKNHLSGCRYFPFKEGRETVPQAVNQFIKQAQQEGGIGMQLTQALTQATQNAGHHHDDVIEIDSADEAEELQAVHPMFEVFWQVSKYKTRKYQYYALT
jgi:hypothetical protein